MSATEENMNWLQKQAWEEAFRMLSRGPRELRKMGFSTLGEAASFEFKRVASLASRKDTAENGKFRKSSKTRPSQTSYPAR